MDRTAKAWAEAVFERQIENADEEEDGYRALIPSIGVLLPKEVSTFLGVAWRAAYRKG